MSLKLNKIPSLKISIYKTKTTIISINDKTLCFWHLAIIYVCWNANCICQKTVGFFLFLGAFGLLVQSWKVNLLGGEQSEAKVKWTEINVQWIGQFDVKFISIFLHFYVIFDKHLTYMFGADFSDLISWGSECI